jgi:uncharacterized protein involved in response to NO
VNTPKRISVEVICLEPFRAFFPLALLAGVAGVALWPLHFWGFSPFYPGQAHARIMAFGLFGGFIIGFISTAFPRMISARSLRAAELGSLLVIYIAMVVSYLLAKLSAGDLLFLLLVGALAIILGSRWLNRRDTPPPGFPLVGLAVLCAVAGVLLSFIEHDDELAFFWITLPKLLVYQGFILLPILGVGGFLLPRFFGYQSRHDFPESIVPPPGWKREAFEALLAGMIILLSFVMEAAGWYRAGPAVRLLATLGYLLRVLPLFRAAKSRNALVSSLRMALGLVLLGYVATLFFPGYRVGMLHLSLVGGFALLTFTVATRIIFSHSGNAALLNRRNLWLTVTAWLILFAVATRISGDIWPGILVTHYIYGAIVWIIASLLWAWHVIPKVMVPDPEE